MEREVNFAIQKGFEKKIVFAQGQLRAIQNILRTPRLTAIY